MSCIVHADADDLAWRYRSKQLNLVEGNGLSGEFLGFKRATCKQGNLVLDYGAESNLSVEIESRNFHWFSLPACASSCDDLELFRTEFQSAPLSSEQ